MADQPIYLTPEWERRLKAMWKKLTTGFSITGPGVSVKNTDENLSISIVQAKPQDPPPAARSETVLVQVAGTVTGGGFYAGTVYPGGLTVTGSSNLSLPGSMSSAAGVLVLNTAETGTSGHCIPADTYHVGKIVGGNTSGLIVAIDGDDTFLVQITKDGGSQGNSSTAASWTYTVKNKTGTVTLGTGVALYRARAVGVTNYAADNSYGLATYISGTLTLLDAYKEYRGKAEC